MSKIPTNFRLNKFANVRIPKPSVLFQRVGGQLSIPKQGYSGDEIATILDTRKTDIDFSAMEKLAESED